MKVKDFYLIESLDISILDESQKKFLDKQLILYQEGSSIIEKISAILKIVKSENFKGIQFQYNEWLFNFVTAHLKVATTDEETRHLQNILGICYNIFGVMHFYKSNYDQALKNYAEAIKICKEQDDKELLLKAYQNISIVYHLQGEITSVLEIYEKAAPLLPFIKNKKILGHYYKCFGSILSQQGNYPKALDYYYKSLKIFEENNLEPMAAEAYANIGFLMHNMQDDLDEGLRYYLKALKLYQKVQNEYGEAEIYIAIGMDYERKKVYDNALEYYNKAIEIQIRLELKNELAFSYLQIAILHENQNQPSLAQKYYQKSIKLSEKTGDKETLSTAMCRNGALEIRNRITEKAKAQIQLGFNLAREIDDPQLMKEAAAAKLTLAIATGNYKLAYEMERLKNEMKDKIQNENIQKEVIKRKFEYESKQALLKKDKEIEVEKKNALLVEEQSDILTLKNEELASKNEIINKQMHELEDLVQKLQESNESLKQFAAVAAHDLKAPLRNIQGFSQLLHKKYAAQLPKQDLDFFMHIIKSCASLKELIDGLLNYSRISSVKLEPEPIDLAAIVSDVKNNLTNIIEDTNIALHITDGLPKVLGQHSLLFQVFLNFINNAIKFRRIEEGLQPTISVESEYYDDDHIKISIKDNGIGIEEEHQNKIFDIFKKLHSSAEYEGSGIGLSVCKKIVERLGGKVWLASEKNVGTTFFFTLALFR